MLSSSHIPLTFLSHFSHIPPMAIFFSLMRKKLYICTMDKKKWQWIIKLIIAILSAIAGALGESATGFISNCM